MSDKNERFCEDVNKHMLVGQHHNIVFVNDLSLGVQCNWMSMCLVQLWNLVVSIEVIVLQLSQNRVMGASSFKAKAKINE
jgi:hypothetical protein